MKRSPAYFSVGEGPALVLLHCSLSSKSQWRALAGMLRDRYRVIAPDLYGYGDTPLPAEREKFTLLKEADLLQGLLDELLQPDEPFHLVGHSYGGAVALSLAHRLPERVKTLTVFEPVAFHLLDSNDPGLEPVRALMRELTLLLTAKRYPEAAATFLDYWSGPGSFASFPPRLQQDFADRTEKLMLDFSALTRTQLTLDDYRRLKMPVTVIAGRSSKAPALLVAQQLSHGLPHSRLLWVESGHMGPVTDPEQVNPLIAASLEASS